MFGIVRSSPSPSPSSSLTDWLDEERILPSKLLKDDSLSIYESTLMKLKQGSRRSLSSDHNSSPIAQESMDFESSCDASPDPSSISEMCSGDASCTSVRSTPDQGMEKGKGVSIQYLFSRYTSSHLKRPASNSCDTGSPTSGLSFCNNVSPTSVSGCSSDAESTVCSKLLL